MQQFCYFRHALDRIRQYKFPAHSRIPPIPSHVCGNFTIFIHHQSTGSISFYHRGGGGSSSSLFTFFSSSTTICTFLSCRRTSIALSLSVQYHPYHDAMPVRPRASSQHPVFRTCNCLKKKNPCAKSLRTRHQETPTTPTTISQSQA